MALALAVVVLVGAGTGDGPTTTAPETTTTTAPDWEASQRQAVADARQALWLDGQPAPAPPVRLEVESVALEEIDGAQVAVLRTCTVQEQGDRFDIFGGFVEPGTGYTTDLRGEVLGRVGGSWTWITDLAQPGRSWDGEAGCATD